VITEHAPLKVTRRSGADFVVLSADDTGLRKSLVSIDPLLIQQLQ